MVRIISPLTLHLLSHSACSVMGLIAMIGLAIVVMVVIGEGLDVFVTKRGDSDNATNQ